jgi:hypothetical protein
MFLGRVEASSTPRSHDCCSFSPQYLSEQVAAANPDSIDLPRPSRCAGSLKRTKKYLGPGARSLSPGCCSGSLLRAIRGDGSRS